MRRAVLYLMEADELRDHVIRFLRDGVMPEDLTREDLAEGVAQFWQSKQDKHVDRFLKANTFVYELEELVESGMTRSEAKQTLARREGHNSVDAFDKWMTRNLDGQKS